MNEDRTFERDFFKIALPIALQGVFQASFSVADQIMVGQLGGAAVAGIGLGGKFSSLYSVVLAAIATAAGIAIAQYLQDPDPRPAARSFYWNLLLTLILAAGFTALSVCAAPSVMGLYSKDAHTVQSAAGYLRTLAWSFPPMAVTAILSTYLRCRGAAGIPLYASVGAAVLNTALNYALIFGKLGFPKMGVQGAALATVLSQICACCAIAALCVRRSRRERWCLPISLSMGRADWARYLGILLPMLFSEFFWSLGENVYAAVYGHIGTDACAAMTLTGPVQALTIGALSGVAQASGILAGRELGRGDFDRAYALSRRMMRYGLAASAVLSVFLVLVRGAYVQIFNVEPEVRAIAARLLLAYALVSPVKVQNMILGGGILRSGGKTKYLMVIDFVGTWFVGVPLACVTAFVFELSIPWVYFILSQEEVVRLLISLWVFQRRSWMRSLNAVPCEEE